ncbi:MAG TPA: hypothetical protein VJU86_22925 [Pyrinomonadaceae bacterium]|nr:hypothetical protein [Pyrinomonadaceae bacterium]
MNRMIKRSSIFASIFVFALFCTGAVLAAAGYTLFGDASLVSPGNNSPTAAEIKYDPAGLQYGGVDFTVPEGLTLADLDVLSTDYKFTAGSCGGGSPRFQINVQDPTTNTVKNIFVYIGPAPGYTGCPAGIYLNTTNLLDPVDFVDATQLGGLFYMPYASAQAAYGTYEVVGIQLVADGYSGVAQTTHIDNVQINNSTTTFESADSCKKGGYTQFTSAPGPFKNQGQCVSYFAKGGQ